MSNIILLNDGMYEYHLPPIPSDEKDILFYDLPKKEQYWRTPIIKNIKQLPERERIEYVQKERSRWASGVWFFNNGEPTYLNGLNYDHLTYMTFKGGKAEYFDHQRFDFYFRELTWNDPKCRGRVWMKPRRYGMTMEEQTEATYRLQEDFSNNVGLQSDTKEKVRTTLLTPIIHSYVKRPKFMRSDYYKPNGKLLVSELSLNTNLAPVEGDENKGDYLLGWLKSFPSLPRSMDGNEMIYITMDEVWKWQESSPKETLESNMKVLMGRNRAGLVSVLSTMGDSDDYLGAIMDGCDIIARSNPKIRDDNGYTLTGLYEYFVSAIYSFDIPPDVFEIDKYGVINKDKHYEYIHNKLSKLDKSSKAYVFEKRRLPLIKEDALMSAQMVTHFSRIRIAERLNQLLAMLPNQKPYVRGRLEYTQDGKVYFEEDIEGLWLWAIHPYFSLDKNIDTRNRFRVINKTIFPLKNMAGCIGYDPINFPKGAIKSLHFSQACLFVRNKFDYINRGTPNSIEGETMAMYLGRPDDPHDVNKEAIKACKYTGYGCMHESSVAHVHEDFESANMLPFLMQGDDGFYGIKPNKKTTSDGLIMLQTRYAPPKTEEDKDNILCYPFEDGLRSLDNFDPNNTTQFDPTMAEIYCEYGLKQLNFSNLSENSNQTFVQVVNEINPKRN